MPQYVKDAGVWRQFILWVKDAGVWRTVIGSVKDANAWRNFGELFNITGNNSVFGLCNNGQANTSPCGATTGGANVVGHGGTGVYTYSWAFVSGETFTVNSPSSGNTTFSKTAAGNNSQHSGVYRCTVTDTGLGQQLTKDVSVVTEHTNNL